MQFIIIVLLILLLGASDAADVVDEREIAHQQSVERILQGCGGACKVNYNLFYTGSTKNQFAPKSKFVFPSEYFKSVFKLDARFPMENKTSRMITGIDCNCDKKDRKDTFVSITNFYVQSQQNTELRPINVVLCSPAGVSTDYCSQQLDRTVADPEANLVIQLNPAQKLGVLDASAQFRTDIIKGFNDATNQEVGYQCNCDQGIGYISFDNPCTLNFQSTTRTCIPEIAPAKTVTVLPMFTYYSGYKEFDDSGRGIIQEEAIPMVVDYFQTTLTVFEKII